MFTKKAYNGKPLEYHFIGDVHGCFEEMRDLYYKIEEENQDKENIHVYLGDLVDKGPESLNCLLWAANVVYHLRKGYCLLGNHEWKVLKILNGENIRHASNAQDTISQVKQAGPGMVRYIQWFLKTCYSNGLMFELFGDNGELVLSAAHAMDPTFMGLKRDDIQAMYGICQRDEQGRVMKDDKGLVIRLPYEDNHDGSYWFVHGHYQNGPNVKITNKCVNVDTGCIAGLYLSSWSYPSQIITQVKSKTNTQEDYFKKVWNK